MHALQSSGQPTYILESEYSVLIVGTSTPDSGIPTCLSDSSINGHPSRPQCFHGRVWHFGLLCLLSKRLTQPGGPAFPALS